MSNTSNNSNTTSAYQVSFCVCASCNMYHYIDSKDTNTKWCMRCVEKHFKQIFFMRANALWNKRFSYTYSIFMGMSYPITIVEKSTGKVFMDTPINHLNVTAAIPFNNRPDEDYERANKNIGVDGMSLSTSPISNNDESDEKRRQLENQEMKLKQLTKELQQHKNHNKQLEEKLNTQKQLAEAKTIEVINRSPPPSPPLPQPQQLQQPQQSNETHTLPSSTHVSSLMTHKRQVISPLMNLDELSTKRHRSIVLPSTESIFSKYKIDIATPVVTPSITAKALPKLSTELSSTIEHRNNNNLLSEETQYVKEQITTIYSEFYTIEGFNTNDKLQLMVTMKCKKCNSVEQLNAKEIIEVEIECDRCDNLPILPTKSQFKRDTIYSYAHKERIPFKQYCEYYTKILQEKFGPNYTVMEFTRPNNGPTYRLKCNICKEDNYTRRIASLFQTSAFPTCACNRQE